MKSHLLGHLWQFQIMPDGLYVRAPHYQCEEAEITIYISCDVLHLNVSPVLVPHLDHLLQFVQREFAPLFWEKNRDVAS